MEELATDADIIQLSLELAAERCEDITPIVYRLFLEKRADAGDLFQYNEIDPQLRGRMLNEILCYVQAAAEGEQYVAPSLARVVMDHKAYGVHDFSLYREFMSALQNALADILGDQWTPSMHMSWKRQCDFIIHSAEAARCAPA